jgi:hypothetical protein
MIEPPPPSGHVLAAVAEPEAAMTGEQRCHAGRCARMRPGLCTGCAALCGNWVAELPSLVAQLSDSAVQPCCDAHSAVMPAATVTTTVGQRVSGSPERPLPGGADRLSWLGRGGTVHPDPARDGREQRLDADCQTGATPVAAVLAIWARMVAEDVGVHPPKVGSLVYGVHGPLLRTSAADVAELCRFLDRWHDWICRRPWSDEFAAEVYEQLSRARAMAGLSERLHRLGACPTDVDGTLCGATLYADPYQDVIVCRRCRSEWPRSRWLWLGGLLREATV